MNFDGIELRFEKGLWLGTLTTRWGLLEILLGGSATSPDEKQLAALRRFASDVEDNITACANRLRFSFLYQPVRIAVNTENRVGVQFHHRLTGNQRQMILEEPPGQKLRPVHGAATFSHEGNVVYNLLTPHMQQFMGRCISAIKKAGITAKGTGNFSILLKETQAELPLDRFYQPVDDPAIIDAVVLAAKQLSANSD